MKTRAELDQELEREQNFKGCHVAVHGYITSDDVWNWADGYATSLCSDGLHIMAFDIIDHERARCSTLCMELAKLYPEGAKWLVLAAAKLCDGPTMISERDEIAAQTRKLAEMKGAA